MKYVYQASVYKPHTITRSQARNSHDIDKPHILTEQFHTHKSDKRATDEVYWKITELFSHEFSYREMKIAIQFVGNTLLCTNWKLPRELDKDYYNIDSNEMDYESEFDGDTLQIYKNMRKMLKNIRHIL